MNKLIMFMCLILLIVCTACGKPKQGDVGPAGKTGTAGSVGATGPQGVPGVDITPVQIINVCPAFTPSYPNTFPEYVICLQDELYGVYSANGGFMALLPPGNYSSNGIGASCTFTVEAHCVIHP